MTDPKKTHRRETLLQIILPVLGGGLLIVTAMVIALLLPTRAQVGIVADVLVMVFVLCPLLLCTLPLYLIFVALAYGMARAHGGIEPYLDKLNALTQAASQRILKLLGTVSQWVINFNSKVEPILQRFSAFDKKDKQA